jgi:tetratricopeptide (TPR) repeat protein
MMMAAMREAIRLNIDDEYVKAYNNRGLAYFDLGKYEQAIRDYSKYIRLDPGIYWASDGLT